MVPSQHVTSQNCVLRTAFVACIACACRPAPAQPPQHDGEAIDSSVVASANDSGTAVATIDASPLVARGPGFPEPGPWASFYGTAAQMGDVAKVAATYRVLDIDADPQDDGEGNFTDAQIMALRANGHNRVLSYLDLGSCEKFRTYWSHAPAPLKPCNKLPQLGSYEGYPDEVWMDLGDPGYQALVVEHVAARIAARKVDGFYLDNLELVEHDANDKNGPCNASCRQGGLDLVRKLRERFPDLLLVMQNATGEVTRTGVTGGAPFPALLDGIAHEEVFAPDYDSNAERELLAWQALGLRSRDGKPFWIAVVDYVGSCKNKEKADNAFGKSKARGFAHYASDASSGQKVVCYWDR